MREYAFANDCGTRIEERALEILWIDEYIEDIRSDLSVFHRVDDMDTMPALRFLAFAERLAHYDGAIRHGAIVVSQREPAAEQQPAPAEDDTPFGLIPGTDLGHDLRGGNTTLMAIDPVWGCGSYSKAPAL